MYHNLLMHSSANGHLGCFHVLPIINSASVNIGVYASVQFWFPWGICPVMGLVGHMAVLFLVSYGIFILFYIVAVSIYIPINSARVPFFFLFFFFFFFLTKTDIFVPYSSCWKLGPLKAQTHKTHSWIKCGIH